MSCYKRYDMHDNGHTNKLGCFKNELNVCVMSAWVGLNPNYVVFNHYHTDKKKRKEYQKQL